MKWERVSEYRIRSDCKRYEIGKTYHSAEVLYTACYVEGFEWGLEVLGYRSSSKSAIGLCQRHLSSLPSGYQVEKGKAGVRFQGG